MGSVTITWVDGHRARISADPAYPDGRHHKAIEGTEVCQVGLDYPASHQGHYFVKCDCGASIYVSASGSRSDPRSVELACKNEP